MRSSMPFRKLTSTPKHFGQLTQKTSQKSKHLRISSMLELLQVNGKQVFEEGDQKKMHQTSQKVELKVEQFIEKQFEGLIQKIKTYCQNQEVKFIQHEKMEKLAMQQKRWYDDRIKEQDVIILFYQRLRQYIKENGVDKIQKINMKRKQDLISQNEQSNVNSCDKQTKKPVIVTLKQKEKLETIEVKEYKVTNPNLRMRSTNGHKFYPSGFINNLPMSCSSTISQILYKQAQVKQFPQFHNFCQKILLQTKPIISDINVLKNQQLQKTNNYLNQIYKKLNLLNTQLSNLASGGEVSPLKKQLNFHQNKKKNIGQEVDYICEILKKINQIHNIDSLFLNCQRPCCQFQNSPNSVQTKAKILINLKQAAKKSIHYKTQITDNYFNRYYNNEKFDMTRVYSLAKTKNQQMENLQKTYSKNREKSKNFKKRSHSLYQNF